MFDSQQLQDPVTFEALFRQYHVPLCRYAQKFVREMSVAEEIVQELFLYLWEHASSLTITTSLESYLYRAVKNRCLNYAKSKWAKAQGADVLLEAPDLTLNTVEEHISYQELTVLVQEGIDQLPEKTRIVFSLSRYAGLSYQEIAQQLGVSVKTVEAQMSTALKRLKAYLQRSGIFLLVGVLLWQGLKFFLLD